MGPEDNPLDDIPPTKEDFEKYEEEALDDNESRVNGDRNED